MSKKIFLLLLLSIALLTGLNAKTVKEFKLEPLTRYRLSFNASGKNSIWELQIFNKEGLLPYEGSFKSNWQKIVSARKKYTHSFLSPRDGALLKFIVDSQRNMPELSDIKLEKIADSNPVVNGDFSAGLDNYSGWNIHKRAKLIKDSNDKILLKCQPNGYAVTDFIPVEPHSVYRYTPGSRMGRVLTYDNGLLRNGILPAYSHKKPFIKIPADAAFIRIEYCDGRDWQKGRVPVIGKVGIELVEKGKETKAKEYPDYPGEIILKVNSALPEVRAAREIQHWVKKISGKEIKVLAAPSDKDNTKIYLGKKWAVKLFPKDLKFLKDSDGFAVRKKANNIYIFSAKPGGTLFGAIRLLEKNTDIIFARPRKDFGTVYSKNSNLKFKHANFIKRPAFALRTSHSVWANPFYTSIWQGRVGLNTQPYFYNQFRREEEGGIHIFTSNFMGVINQSPEYSPKIVKKKYPELYALKNGMRAFHHKFICPTHPEAVKALTAGFCAVVKKAQNSGITLGRVGVRVQDGWTVCSCARCMKAIKLPNGKLLKPKSDSSIRDPLFYSTRKAILMNQVAKEFAKVYPDITLSTEAYVYAAEPPAIPYAPSLTPLFCAYPSSSLRFPLLDENNSPDWKRKFQGFLSWSQKNNSKLSMFAYYYTNCYSSVADAAAGDWLAMTKTGAGGRYILMDAFRPDNIPLYRNSPRWRAKSKEVLNKNRGEWEYNGIEKWVMTRLMWDPSVDPQKLREYYIKRAYKEAAPEMLKFYNIIRKNWKNTKIKYSVNCHSRMADLFDTFIAKTGSEKKLRSLLVKAEKKALNPNSKILIQRNLEIFNLIAKSLNRTYVPFIQKSTAEWNDANSTFWLQALKKGGFKRVSTWKDLKKIPATRQTGVSIMRDDKNLYFRFHALKAGQKDRVELVLAASRHKTKYFFALNRAGKAYVMRNYSPWNCPGWKGKVKNGEDNYIAMFKVPISAIKELNTGEKEFKFLAKFARLVYDKNGREESTLTGVSITMSHYDNYWTTLSVEKRKQFKMKK